MKKIFLIVAAISCMFSSCKKEGCTDASAENFNADAKKSDGLCVYKADVVIHYNSASAQMLQDAGVNKLTYFVDGVSLGTHSTAIYWNTAPGCFDPGTISKKIELGGDASKLVFIEYYFNGVLMYSEEKTLQAGFCNPISLN